VRWGWSEREAAEEGPLFLLGGPSFPIGTRNRPNVSNPEELPVTEGKMARDSLKGQTLKDASENRVRKT